MDNFCKFLNDLEKESKECLSNINNKIKETCTVINDSLLGPKVNQGTPVITGHLKNNWIVTKDNEFTDVAGSRENPDKSTQEKHWLDFVTSQDLYLSHNIYFNNNVYYGPWVNYGVGQPAQKFREAAKQRGEEYIKANKK